MSDTAIFLARYSAIMRAGPPGCSAAACVQAIAGRNHDGPTLIGSTLEVKGLALPFILANT
jgi:hypothetical protein